jgi:hypothetical protein
MVIGSLMGYLLYLRQVQSSRASNRSSFRDRRHQEIADAFCDIASMRFQGEVTSVEEADNCTRIVPFERLGARRHKKRIVLAPHRQKRRLVRAEVFLE